MNSEKPIWHGVVLVAGGAVGAGMFALPMVSAGAWSAWALMGLVCVWWVTYLAAKLLLDSNIAVLGDGSSHNRSIHAPPLSFGTLVKSVLGVRWALLNNISLVFIMMILMYAYISAGASIVSLSLDQFGLSELDLNRSLLSVLFSVVVALIVWLGTSAVAKLSVVLMAMMALSFLIAVIGLFPQVDVTLLMQNRFSYYTFLLAAIPVYVTAFACAGLVPTLVNHYRSDRGKVERCLFWGTLLALGIYIVWLAATFGTIGRDGFAPILEGGANTSDLMQALSVADAKASTASLSQKLMWFSHCAIITSFLSIGLGLFHFIQDKLGLGARLVPRSKAVLICFLPPTIASFFYPKGFLVAIGYAGLFVAFSFFVVPAVMSMRRLSRHRTFEFSPTWIIPTVFGAGLVCAGLKTLYTFGYLAKFP